MYDMKAGVESLAEPNTRRYRRHMFRSRGFLLLHAPVLGLQLAVVCTQCAPFASAFVAQPLAGKRFHDRPKHLAGRRVVCMSNVASAESASLTEPKEEEIPYGFWAPASKDVPLAGHTLEPFEVRGVDIEARQSQKSYIS